MGSRLSATIQAFSSKLQRRRRPTPVITSIRRKLSAFVPVVALGLRIAARPDLICSDPPSSVLAAGSQGGCQTTLTPKASQCPVTKGGRGIMPDKAMANRHRFQADRHI